MVTVRVLLTTWQWELVEYSYDVKYILQNIGLRVYILHSSSLDSGWQFYEIFPFMFRLVPPSVVARHSLRFFDSLRVQ